MTLTCAVWHFYCLLSPFSSLLSFLPHLRSLSFPILHSLSLFYTLSPSPSSILPLLLSLPYSLLYTLSPSLSSILPLFSLFYIPSPLPLLHSLLLLSSYSRTPQSPRVGTTITKKARNSPATTEPTSIPVPVTRTALSGTKRLRSVSLEKLPASLTAKRPSRTPTQDSTPVEHPPTLRTGGNEGTFMDP